MASPKFTKDSLKKFLIEKQIPIPGPNAKKEEFMKLYNNYVQQCGGGFSSDEEGGGTMSPTTSRRLSRTPSQTPERNNAAGAIDPISRARNVTELLALIKDLPDHEVYKRLKLHGDNIGPVTPSTRNVYHARLMRREAAVLGLAVDSPERASTNGTGNTGLDNGFSDDDVEPPKPTRRTSTPRGGRGVTTSEQDRAETTKKMQSAAHAVTTNTSTFTKTSFRKSYGSPSDGPSAGAGVSAAVSPVDLPQDRPAGRLFLKKNVQNAAAANPKLPNASQMELAPNRTYSQSLLPIVAGVTLVLAMAVAFFFFKGGDAKDDLDELLKNLN